MTAGVRDGPPMTCPDCGGPVWPEREKLCPDCGYPLMFLAGEAAAEQGRPDPGPVARRPRELDDTDELPATPAALVDPLAGTRSAPRAPDDLECPRCGQLNPGARHRCQSCGAELRVPAARVAPPPPPARRRWVPATLVAAGVTSVVVAGAVTALTVRGRDNPPPPPPVVELAEVRPARAAASSTLEGYPASHLIDGDENTAWQARGVEGQGEPANIGVRLIFEFAEPVRLARITLRNGPADSYTINQRVARLDVDADEWQRRWPLSDDLAPAPLELPADLPPTRRITLTVRDIYPGTEYPADLAVAEVLFQAYG